MKSITRFVQKTKWNVQSEPAPNLPKRQASKANHDQAILFKALDRSLSHGYHSVKWSEVGWIMNKLGGN